MSRPNHFSPLPCDRRSESAASPVLRAKTVSQAPCSLLAPPRAWAHVPALAHEATKSHLPPRPEPHLQLPLTLCLGTHLLPVPHHLWDQGMPSVSPNDKRGYASSQGQTRQAHGCRNLDPDTVCVTESPGEGCSHHDAPRASSRPFVYFSCVQPGLPQGWGRPPRALPGKWNRNGQGPSGKAGSASAGLCRTPAPGSFWQREGTRPSPHSPAKAMKEEDADRGWRGLPRRNVMAGPSELETRGRRVCRGRGAGRHPSCRPSGVPASAEESRLLVQPPTRRK